jgi:hypothetical protein
MSKSGCKNCKERLAVNARFCHVCGQSIKEISRPWREFAGEAFEDLFDVDGRMLTSLRLLLSRPGFLSHEYINGRRNAYTPPIRMYLVISLVFFFVLPLILPESSANPEHKVSVDLYSKGMFLLLPVFALLLKVFYRAEFYLAHLVFTTHLFSAMYIVLAFMFSIENLADRYLAVALLQFVLLVYMLVYSVVALRVTYEEKWQKSALKFVALLFAFLPVLGIVIEFASRQGIT